MNNKNIILISGSGRSGTTVLRKILGAHSDVCEIPELRFTLDPGGLLDFYQSNINQWSPVIYSDRYSKLKKLLKEVDKKPKWKHLYRRLIHKLDLQLLFNCSMDIPYGRLDADKFYPNFSSLSSDLLNRLQEFEYSSFWAGSRFLENINMSFLCQHDQKNLAKILGGYFYELVDDALQHSHAKYYLEKNTWYILFFDKFLELVPTAKLVHIYRDPRDVVLSLTSQVWAPKVAEDAAKYYKCIMDRWRMVRESLPDESFIEVSYESLVYNTKVELERIQEHTSIALSYHNYGLSTKSIGRWVHGLNKDSILKIETLLSDEINHYGYMGIEKN